MRSVNAVEAEEACVGKDGSVAQLYRRYQHAITYLCYGYTKDWDDAREMAQEAFLKAYRAFDGFEGRCQPMTWITRIAINQCLGFIAARGRERLAMLNFLHEAQCVGQEEGWEERRSRMAVADLVKSADPVTRRVLGLAMHQGLTHSQIAISLGVSRVAVTRRITRFKRKVLGRVAAPA